MILREDDDLINTYWFQLLHVFVNGLTIIELDRCRTDDKLLTRQYELAFIHLERVLIHPSKRAFFNFPCNNRVVPSSFNGNTLNDCAVWLFRRFITSESQLCRDKCIKLFEAIAPLINKYRGLDVFLNENEINFLNLDDVHRLLNDNAVIYDNDRNLLRWLENLKRAIDYYRLACKHTLQHNIRSEFLKAFDEFVSEQILNTNRRVHFISAIREQKYYHELKFATIRSILELSIAYLRSNRFVRNTNDFFGETYCKFLLHCIFEMENIVAYSNCDVNRFGAILKELIETHRDRIGDHFKSFLIEAIHFYNLNDKLTRLVNFKLITSNDLQLLKGVTFMQETFLNDYLDIALRYEDVVNESTDETSNDCNDLKLKIALNNRVNVSDVIDFLIEQSNRSDEYCNVNGLCKLRKHQKGLLSFLLSNFEGVICHLFEKHGKLIDDIVAYVIDLILYLSDNNEEYDQTLIANIMPTIIKCWPKIIPHLNARTNDGINLLKSAIRLTEQNGNQLNNISTWILTTVRVDQINLDVFLTRTSDLLQLFHYMRSPVDQNEEIE